MVACNGLINPTVADPVASPSTTTIYTVTVVNAQGWTSTDEVVVTVNPITLNATVILEGAYTGGAMANYLQQQGRSATTARRNSLCRERPPSSTGCWPATNLPCNTGIVTAPSAASIAMPSTGAAWLF